MVTPSSCLGSAVAFAEDDNPAVSEPGVGATAFARLFSISGPDVLLFVVDVSVGLMRLGREGEGKLRASEA